MNTIFMTVKAILVSDPENKLVVGKATYIKPIRGTIGCLVSAVKAFNHLLVRHEFL